MRITLMRDAVTLGSLPSAGALQTGLDTPMDEALLEVNCWLGKIGF